MIKIKLKQCIPFFVLALVASGCASSTLGPGAGAAQSTVKGPIEEVTQHAQDVLREMNIQVTGNSTKNSGEERQLMGKMGDTDVTVTLDNAPNSMTSVEVDASKNLVSGNRDLAREILSKIIQKS